MPNGYSNNVFVNCPFDEPYKRIFNAVIFAIFACGFRPRCALEAVDSSEVRIDKIFRITQECKFGLHDLSRTELDEENQLPRFNMPLELGIFLGAKRFGARRQLKKSALVLDRQQYRYQIFVSDLSGMDILSHSNRPKLAVVAVRDWLNSGTKRSNIPEGGEIWRRYERFSKNLPLLCERANLSVFNLHYTDYLQLVSMWIREQIALSRT